MDKVVLKITGILVLIIGIFYCFLIIGAIWGIPLIIGGTKFLKYSNMTDERLYEEKASLLGWSIFFLFFTVIGGILGLVYYFSLNGNLGNIYTNKQNSNYLEELEKLKQLYDSRAITKEEYETKKKQILGL